MKAYLAILLVLASVTCLAQQKPPVIQVDLVRLADSRYQFVDKENKNPVNQFFWKEAEPFVNGFAKVYNNDGWTFVNGQGSPVTGKRYNDVKDFVNKMAAVKSGSVWGFIDESGNEVISPKFELVFDFGKNQSIVYDSKEWKLINRKGNFVSNADPDLLPLYRNLTRNRHSFLKPDESGQSNNKKSDIAHWPDRDKFLSEVPAAGGCPANISFESGSFTNWSCFIGSTFCSGGVNVTSVSPSAPITGRHTLLTRSTPAALDPYGLFPLNSPNGSTYCVKLGNNINGSQAERISYSLTVPASATNFSITYQYAVVFQDPSHTPCEQPRFSAKLFDPATNSYLPCGTYEYVSTSNIPGFQNSIVDPSVRFKPWSTAFINLTPYAGMNLILQFTTDDCTLGGHWGYAYLDVDDNCDLSAEIQTTCTPPYIQTLTGPPGFQTYNWWNFDFTLLHGTGQSITFDPGLPNGTNLWLELIPFSGLGCRDTMPITISTAIPTAIFSPRPPQCLGGNNFTFTSNSTVTGGSINSIVWNFGDGNTGNGSPVNHTYTSSGTFTVKLIVTSNTGCKDSTTQVVTVYPQPIPVFAQPADQCFRDHMFTFTSNSTVSSGSIISHEWNFGDGNTASGIMVSHSYAIPGTYTIKLIVTTDNNCKDSLSRIVTVFAMPTAIFAPQAAQCLGSNNFSFTSTSTVGSGSIILHDWDFGDGNTGSGITVNHTYATFGSYTVRLIVTTNGGCKDTTFRPVTVYPQPAVAFSQPAGQCFKVNNFSFTSSSSVGGGAILISQLWDFGDGGTGSGINVSHSYLAAGTYNVKLVVTTNDGCKDSLTRAVQVFAEPSVVFNQPAPQCFANNNFSFTSSSTVSIGTIISHNWNFGDGGAGSGINVTHSYLIAGTFPVKLVVTTDNGCKDSTTKQVDIYADPIPLVVANRSLNFCAGDSVSLTSNSLPGSGSISALQWYNGATPIPGATGPKITVLQTGNYQLEVTNSNGCRKKGVVMRVTVFPLPSETLVLPNTNFICDGLPVTLHVTGTGGQFQWFMNGVMIPGANGPNYLASQTGSYTVQLTSPQGCKNFATGTVSLSLLKKPVAEFNYPVFCAGLPINFNNLSDSTPCGPVNWTWDFGDGTRSALFEPAHIYPAGTSYPISLNVTSVICPNLSDTKSKVIQVEAPRPGIFYVPVNAMKNTNTLLKARTFGSDYLWMPSTGLSNQNISSPYFNYDQETQFIIRIRTDAGCTTYDTQLVRVFKMIDIKVPKAFSPNGDGHNDKLDVFLIGIKELKYFRVFNRWGQLLYETKDALQRWDGTYSGVKQPLETYVWIAEGVGDDGTTILRRGQTVLIR